ncbi:MAG: hypothetical protein KBD65_03690 [Candidatus Moranbacteria bacterium]|nr:hypothetical protein [Candidatus Moranbacteria bacterium]
MSSLTEKTLAIIAKEQIQPIPLWKSQGRNIAYWFGTILLVAFSALAAALSFHALFEIDWDAYAKADFSFLQILLSGVPLFSAALLALFLLGSIAFLHQTRRGYRYPVLMLTGVFLVTSSVFGYFIEGSPLDEPAEKFFLFAVPHAEKIQASLLPSAERQWSQPERGLLGGAVLSSNATDLQLLDSSENLWTVNYADATISEAVGLEPYEDVKIIGDQEGEYSFKATEIREWKNADSSRKREDDAVRQEEDDEEEEVSQQEREEADDESEKVEQEEDEEEEEEKETEENEDQDKDEEDDKNDD